MSIEQLDLLAQLPEREPEPAAAPDVLHQLEQWVAVGWLRALDRALAVFLLDLIPDSEPLVLLAAALASHQLGHGHVCLDLDATLAAPDLSLSLTAESRERGGRVRIA